jgi:hypothetical protein
VHGRIEEVGNIEFILPELYVKKAPAGGPCAR